MTTRLYTVKDRVISAIPYLPVVFRWTPLLTRDLLQVHTENEYIHQYIVPALFAIFSLKCKHN